MISGFFKLVFYLFIAYLIYLVIRFLIMPRPRSKTGHPPRQLSGVMVKDEACNTYLPLEDAIKDKIDGKEYYFCSEDCRKKFLEQRKNRAGKSPA